MLPRGSRSVSVTNAQSSYITGLYIQSSQMEAIEHLCELPYGFQDNILNSVSDFYAIHDMERNIIKVKTPDSPDETYVLYDHTDKTCMVLGYFPRMEIRSTLTMTWRDRREGSRQSAMITANDETIEYVCKGYPSKKDCACVRHQALSLNNCAVWWSMWDLREYVGGCNATHG